MSIEETQSGSSRFLRRFIWLPLSWRLGLVGLIFATYTLCSLYFLRSGDVVVTTWGTVVAAASGWLLGIWGGLLGGLLLLVLNGLLAAVGQESGSFGVWPASGAGAAIIIGLIVGWLQTMAKHQETELAQRKLTEAALRASEEQHRQMFTNNQAVKLLIDPHDGQIVAANPAAAQFYGYSANALKQMKISDINTLPPPRIKEELDRAAQQDRTYFLFQHRLASGEVRHVEVYSGPVTMGGQRLLYSIIHDITERVQAESALSESEQQYRSLIEQSNDAIYLLVNDRFELINPRFGEMFGVTLEDVRSPSFSWLDLVDPQSIPAIEERRRKTAAEEAVPSRYEFVARSRDGRSIPVEASVSYIEYHGQRAIQGILRDITERYEAQEKLRQSEEYFRVLIEHALDIITVVNADGTIRYKSPSIERILGYTPEELIGQNVLAFIHPDDRFSSIKAFMRKMNNPQNTEMIAFRFRHKNGDWRIIEATGRILLDSAVVKGIVVNSREVTERHLTEQALRRQATELEALAEISAELRLANNVAEIMPIILRRTTLLDPKATSSIFLLDSQAGELVVRGWYPPEQDLTGWRHPGNTGITGHIIQTGELYIAHDLQTDPMYAPLDDHKEFWYGIHSLISVPLRTQHRIIGIMHVGLQEQREFAAEEIRLLTAIAEITGSALDRALVLETLEQRVNERTRALAEANTRLKELDYLKSKFVSDVSHELRTPVANLSLYLDLLERGRSDKRGGYLAVLREQTDRLTHLIEDILDLTRLELNQEAMPWLTVEINDLVQQAFTSHALRAEALGLNLRFDAQPDLPPIQGDPRQVLQVITNLITNALNYTPTGEVYIQTGQDIEQQRVYLQVKDTGIGIDPSDLPHLFDRFYRGKRVSQSAIPGTGLGLAIVKEIVDLHHGEIIVSGKPDRGADFQIWWPALTAKEASSEQD